MTQEELRNRLRKALRNKLVYWNGTDYYLVEVMNETNQMDKSTI